VEVNRRAFLASLGAVVATAAFPAPAAAAPIPATEAPGLIHRAVCIRLGPGGPYLLDSRTHANVGVTKVGVNTAGDLVVYTDWRDGERLIYAGVNVDLSLGAKGVTCGVSGGGPKSTIRFVDGNGVRRRANSSYFNPTVDNVWFLTISTEVAA
jgi:hypothetical protein